MPAFAGFAFGDRQRPRAHQGHVALEHIEELWQLVHAGLAEELADRRDARIVFQLERWAILLAELLQLGLLGFGIDAHGAELVNLKRLSAQARAVLREDDRTGAAESDHRCRDEHQRRE